MNKELNHLMLCGVIKKVKRTGLVLDFGYGTIFAQCDKDTLKEIAKNYTVSVNGVLSKKLTGIYVIVQSVVIFDKKPHYINY